jgi:hypothetical protein
MIRSFRLDFNLLPATGSLVPTGSTVLSAADALPAIMSHRLKHRHDSAEEFP